MSAARRVLSVARLRPFEVATPEGRSRERYRRAFLSTVTSGFSRAVTVSAALISVPLTLRYLGPERYGLWMILSSVIAILGFSDLGINNGLLTGISHAHGAGDRGLARQYVSSAFFLLTAIAAILGLVFVLVQRWIPWAALFRIHSPQAMAEVGPALATLVACILLNIPAGIVTRVQAGYQDGFTANLWSCLGSGLCLAALLLVIHLKGSLPFLVLAMAGTPLVALLLNGVVQFGVRRPWLRPSWSCVTPNTMRRLLRLSGLFFVLQLAVAVSYSSDNLVLARILGPEAVAQYAVPSKLFSLVCAAVSLIVNPLWPAYGEAKARRDVIWIRTTFLRSLALAGGVSGVLASLLMLCGGRMIRAWVGPTIHATPLLLAGLGIWSVVWAVSMAFAALLNGLAVTRFQLLVVTVGSVSNILLSVYLTHRIGIPGVVYGSIIAQTFAIVIPSVWYVRRHWTSITTAKPIEIGELDAA